MAGICSVNLSRLILESGSGFAKWEFALSLCLVTGTWGLPRSDWAECSGVPLQLTQEQWQRHLPMLRPVNESEVYCPPNALNWPCGYFFMQSFAFSNQCHALLLSHHPLNVTKVKIWIRKMRTNALLLQQFKESRMSHRMASRIAENR